jgi:hypothetical protein
MTRLWQGDAFLATSTTEPPSAMRMRPSSGLASRPAVVDGHRGSLRRTAGTDRVADDTVARMTESATIIPAETLAAKRSERERQRQKCQPYAGSILDALDDEDNPPSAPASPAQLKQETRR